MRGYEHCNFHADILALFKLQELLECKDRNDLNIDCPGGGRIKIEDKSIYIYGFSQGFGKADHQLTLEII